MVSVCLPSDALLQYLPSYLGFSYLGHGISLHGCSSKAQPLLLTLDEGYLLTTTPPALERGIAPLGPPVPAWPLLLGRGVAPPGCRPWPWTWGSSSPLLRLTLSHLTKSVILFASSNVLIVFNFSKIQSEIIHCDCVHSLNLYSRVIPCFMGLTSCRHHASYHRILLGLFECFLVEFLAFSSVLCISYKMWLDSC